MVGTWPHIQYHERAAREPVAGAGYAVNHMGCATANFVGQMYQIGDCMNMRIDKLIQAIVWRLPHRVMVWAFYRMLAYATQGEWSKEHPDDVSAWQVIQRWNTRV